MPEQPERQLALIGSGRQLAQVGEMVFQVLSLQDGHQLHDRRCTLDASGHGEAPRGALGAITVLLQEDGKGLFTCRGQPLGRSLAPLGSRGERTEELPHAR